jgi:hypothetical protein
MPSTTRTPQTGKDGQDTGHTTSQTEVTDPGEWPVTTNGHRIIKAIPTTPVHGKTSDETEFTCTNCNETRPPPTNTNVSDEEWAENYFSYFDCEE